ncbi:MAG: GlsB/YeaQ/YmgE family stress response membrane protein [Caldilineaceae bacterium]|nr:GlsB/YeaQ/YmgE family stress response membrane protein [Caldilineaceae bacterium]
MDSLFASISDPRVTGLLITVIIGVIAGWFASHALQGRGLGLLGNMVVGIVGAYLGKWLFGLLNLSVFRGWGYMGEFFYALIGALVILIFFSRFFKS